MWYDFEAAFESKKSEAEEMLHDEDKLLEFISKVLKKTGYNSGCRLVAGRYSAVVHDRCRLCQRRVYRNSVSKRDWHYCSIDLFFQSG